MEIEIEKMKYRDDPMRRVNDKIRSINSHRSINQRVSTGRGRQSKSMQRSILETSGNHRRVKYDIELAKKGTSPSADKEDEKKEEDAAESPKEQAEQSAEAVKLNK